MGLSRFGNLSRSICTLPLYTVLRAQLKPFADSQRPHAESAAWDAKYLGKSLTVLNLVALLSLVVLEDKVAILGRQLAQATLEASDAIVQIAAGLKGRRLGFRDLVERSSLAAIAVHLAQEHPRNPNTIRGDVSDLVALENFPGAPINGLVGVLIRSSAAPPLEHAHQIAPDFKVTVGRRVTIRSKRSKQAIESILSERPFLPSCIRHGSTAILPAS
jgi:hypothetical protein